MCCPLPCRIEPYSPEPGGRSDGGAGGGGVLSLLHWTGAEYRRRVSVVGENGIKPGVAYRLSDTGEFVEVTE